MKIVYVLTCGNPSGACRKARCNVVSDQVAVPSCSRSGVRRASCRSAHAQRYCRRLRTAAMPWCNRRQALPVETGDQLGDVTRTPPSSMRRVSVALTICYGRQRLARATWLARSLAERLICVNTGRSSSVRARAGRFCGGSSCTPDCSPDPQFTKANLLWQGSRQ